MIPGKALILTCPYCGHEKEVMTLLSGNTFGAEYWSDGKMEAPMLPEVSYVQECPNCNKFYIKARQKGRRSEKSVSFHRGTLFLFSMMYALWQFEKEGFQSTEEETKVRMMYVHAFNDQYYRSGRTLRMHSLHVEVLKRDALWLIENMTGNEILKAELYREIGDFSSAKQILETLVVEDESKKKLVDSMMERIEKKDSVVFKLG